VARVRDLDEGDAVAWSRDLDRGDALTGVGTVIASGFGVLAGLAALARWLRVSQREHYDPGRCLVTLGRWIRLRSPNPALAALAVGGLVLAVAAPAAGNGALGVWGAGASAAAVILFPWPLRVIGRPRLRLTRRARTLAASSLALSGAAAALLAMALSELAAAGSAAGLPTALALVAAAAPAIVDAAAAVLAPLERRLLERHRRRAAAKLARVAPFVIAVTGSWGKTSTKNHIRDLLSGAAAVAASPASFNNTAGLSLTINDHMPDSAEVLVAEMGMYRPGEIKEMCSWVRPDVAVITAVGTMHLERAGSMERIAAAKAEILERARTAVLWVDDPRLDELSRTAPAPTVMRVGAAGGLDLDVEVAETGSEMIVRAGGSEIGRIGADAGVHPANVGCAVAAALAYGAAPDRIGPRLAALGPPQHRAAASRSPAGVLVVDDTFNSNPAGALRAVEDLARRVAGRRVVVTPGMVELGSEQRRANAELARAVIASGAELVIVGRTNRRALLEGAGGEAVSMPDRSAARDWVREHLGEGDGVLWENDLPDHYP